jgi:subfamily B ATP-binding cassette protein MsbA
LSNTQASATAAPGATHTLVARLFREHLRHHLGRLVVAMACMVAAAAATAANAWLMEPVLDEVFVNRNVDMLYLVTFAVLGVAAVKASATYAQVVLMNHVGQRIIADTQISMFGHLMRADLAYFHANPTGRLVSSFIFDSNLLREAVTRAVAGIAKDFVTLSFLLALMFYQNWKLALAAVVVIPPAAVAMRNLGKRMRKASTATQEETGNLSELLTETFSEVRVVKAYGMEGHATGRASAAVERRLKHLLKLVRTRAAATPITEMLGGVAVAIVIFYGGFQVIDGTTTPGTFFSFIAALVMAYQPLKSLANLNTALQEGLAAAQRIFAMLDVEPEIADRPDTPALEVGGGAIEFDRVSFAYRGGAPALRDVSLTVPAGHTVARVGPSGAGKSTLLNLIPRFFDISAGRVAIDGSDVREVTLASLRGAIALVSQETGLFNDTVRANIAYGRPGASDDDIAAVARAAAAHDFIVELEDGYETMIGENGVRLSGGQRQRLAIARAMLKDAPILLLDEATSALDAEAERQVQEALKRLMKGRTTLVIAHRLSTVLSADRIHVMEQGTIVEAGSHAELIAKRGVYARHHALQFADDAPADRVVGARA